MRLILKYIILPIPDGDQRVQGDAGQTQASLYCGVQPQHHGEWTQHSVVRVVSNHVTTPEQLELELEPPTALRCDTSPSLAV